MIWNGGGRHLESFLEGVAPFCPSMSPWRATTTPISSKISSFLQNNHYATAQRCLWRFLFLKNPSATAQRCLRRFFFLRNTPISWKTCFVSKLEVQFRANVSKVLRLSTNKRRPELSPGSRGSPGNELRSAVRNPPSTRAGGQDDVSSKQTPSNEICVCIYGSDRYALIWFNTPQVQKSCPGPVGKKVLAAFWRQAIFVYS